MAQVEDIIDFYDLCIISSDVPVDTYDDEDLMDFILNTRSTTPRNCLRTPIIRFTKSYVTKRYDREDFPDVKAAIEFAVSLNISAPPIKRVVDLPEYGFVECIQPYIKDSTSLDKAWSKLGLLQSLYLGWSLRRTLKKMHNTNPQSADGGGGGALQSGKCRSFWFEEEFYGVPDHATAKQMNEIINFWTNADRNSGIERAKTTQQHFQTCEGPISLSESKRNPSSILCFVHGDLAPRNIMLQRKGLKMKLWIVDWDYAGWYPKYLEFAGMQNNVQYDKWTKFALLRWNWFSRLSGGRVQSKKTIMINDAKARMHKGVDNRYFNLVAGASSGLRWPPDPAPTGPDGDEKIPNRDDINQAPLGEKSEEEEALTTERCPQNSEPDTGI